jgi:pentatricopeptide repeat protein
MPHSLSSSDLNIKPHPVQEEELRNAYAAESEWQQNQQNETQQVERDVSDRSGLAKAAASAEAAEAAFISPNKKRRAADHGNVYFPEQATQPVEDKAPQALDHFKRGYQERAAMRQKDSSNMENRQRFHDRHTTSGGGGPVGGGGGPVGGGGVPVGGGGGPVGGGGRGGGGGGDGGGRGRGGGGRFSRRDSDEGRNRGDFGGGSDGVGGDTYNLHGFNATDFVDRIFHKVSSMNPQQAEAVVDEDLHNARVSFQEAFVSGKAMTALIATAARRRHIRLAHHFWNFMDRANLPKNIFHYNAMISVTEKDKNLRQALDLLKEMKERGIEKNEVT